MPEPTVDLNLGPQQGAQQAPQNPLGMASGLAELQNTLNTNRQFQQQFAARQQAGAIIASAPDWQSAAKALQGNAQVSGWLPEITTSMLHNQAINQEIAGAQQTQAQSALQGVWKGLAMAAAKPELYGQAFKAATSAIPPDLQKFMKTNGDPIGNIDRVLSPLAKSDPQGLQKLIAAGQLASGVDGSAVFGMSGRVTPTLQQSAGGGSPLRGGFVDSPASSLGTSGEKPATTSPDSLPSHVSSPIATDGKPLYAPPSSYIPTQRDATGLPIRSQEEQAQVNQLSHDFIADQPKYDNAANSIGNLQASKDELSKLAEGNTWMKPGFLGTMRLQIGKMLNYAHDLSGASGDEPVDMDKVAAGEALGKNSWNQAFQLIHSTMGSHSGAESLQAGFQAVPGIENTPLGGMLVADGLIAQSNWIKDQGAYKQQWASNTRGDLRNADESFRQQHPPSDYIGGVMKKYGMGANGFVSADAVKSAYTAGLINRPIAEQELRKFGGQ